MTNWQIVALVGAAIGLGIALIVWFFIPRSPDLKYTLTRLFDEHQFEASASHMSDQAELGTVERFGRWFSRRFPTVVTFSQRSADLDLLQLTPASYIGQRVLAFFVGLAAPPVVTAVITMLGFRVPLAIPLVASIGMGVVASLLIDQGIRQRAQRAREEFAHVLTAYID
jgi:hypothetical protein